MTVRIYMRASAKDQDNTRALADLVAFSTGYEESHVKYVEYFSGTKLDRSVLAKLLKDAGDHPEFCVTAIYPTILL